ncbi:DUF6881 domain-containing protein [Streptomyces sp. NPDC001380]|uniref:DUF6881 domain-containing protein n=1 Tax=Streptomyces sp. NPDC001380 TaxID=3364566 RepID=UPI003673BFA8
MRHVRVTWTHDFADEPVEILSELDEEDREGRKVEVFHGGRRARADASHETAATGLGEVPFPPPLPARRPARRRACRAGRGRC